MKKFLHQRAQSSNNEGPSLGASTDLKRSSSIKNNKDTGYNTATFMSNPTQDKRNDDEVVIGSVLENNHFNLPKSAGARHNMINARN